MLKHPAVQALEDYFSVEGELDEWQEEIEYFTLAVSSVDMDRDIQYVVIDEESEDGALDIVLGPVIRDKKEQTIATFTSVNGKGGVSQIGENRLSMWVGGTLINSEFSLVVIPQGSLS